ncbi:MAG: hypothetical protein JWN83_812 [Chitinophagaceae bacterium]|nr:hypothetical protein [Chitinophagaceae bacterium]
MEILNLLIIEDEDTQLQVYNDSIDQFNKKNEIKIKQTICKNFEEGESALKSPFYDAALIDLKLSNSDDLEGKKLVETVYKKIRIPIFIVSGSIAQIDDIPENALLKKRLRTELMSGILSEIFDIYKTGITSFLRPDGLMDQKLTEIFWNNLSQDLSIWIKHNNQSTLLRYILSHFHEYLEINTDGDFEEYHQQEFYLSPPIKKNPHTGDLIQIENRLYLILTPACDIIINYKKDENGKLIPFRKAENLILAAVKEFDYKVICADKNKVLQKGKIKEYVKNASLRYHYLPPFKNENGYLIDFQDLSSVSFNTDFKREATISSPFIKDIISRFANYYSRQGQPTYKQDLLVDYLFDKK